MLLVDAIFINNSGGKVLLDYLVSKIESTGIDVFYLFDKRCSNDFHNISSERKQYVVGSIFERHKFYQRNRFKYSKVLCFGNVPPTISLNIPVYTYFHNVSLLHYPASYRWKEKLQKYLKSKVILHFSNNTDFFVVQTKDVKKLLLKNVKISSNKCKVIPFFNTGKVNNNLFQNDSFAFISNGNTHKNHGKLIEAWYELAKLNLYPELHLTVTENFPNLISVIGTAKSKGLKIVNHGYIDAYSLYSSCKYLVYPSLCESFGLGLIEAASSGCDIIASDLPYVYEVVLPTATFDPLDAKSIANSVENILSGKNRVKTELIVNNEIQELLELIKP